MPKTNIPKNPTLIKVGKNIKYSRRMRNVTQSQLGKSLNISAQQIHKYETGGNDISFIKLLKIAEILNISLDDLINNEK